MKVLGKISPLVGGLVVAAMIVALAVVFWPGGDKRELVAEFPRTISLYAGSDVKILGVPVGKVDSVTPAGTHVVVKISYDAQYKVPKDAKAAVIAPSIVGDRFVQLTPAYSGGAVLPNNARLGEDRTATPLELDQIFGSLNQLNIALGPDGANKPDASGVGPLTRLLSSTAANFGGQGEQFNKTLRNLGQLTGTLSDNKDQFFSTINQLEKFTNKLAVNDKTVRNFNDSLAGGADVLATERQELAAALTNLAVAMKQVRSFVRDNRAGLTSNIKGLNQISKTLVKQRDALDKSLSYAPVALNNLALTYDRGSGGTLDTRASVGEVLNQIRLDPGAVLCGFVSQAQGGKTACPAIQDALKNVKLPGAPRPGALSGTAPGTNRVIEPVDLTLGGLVAR